MTSKAAIYSLFMVGCVFLVAVWAWALAAGVSFLGVASAMAATWALCVASSVITVKKIKEDARFSISDVASAGLAIAIAPFMIGAFITIWEYVPSRSGGGTYVERRYALLFFAIVAYLIVFPWLSRRKIRSKND